MLQSIKKTANGLVALFKDGTSVQFGEKISASCTADTTTVSGDTDLDVTGMVITLPTGKWLLGYNATLFVRRVATTTTPVGRVRITDSANTAIAETESYMQTYQTVDATSFSCGVSRFTMVNISVPTTYKVRVACNAANTSATATVVSSSIVSSLTNPDNASVLFGIRFG